MKNTTPLVHPLNKCAVYPYVYFPYLTLFMHFIQITVMNTSNSLTLFSPEWKMKHVKASAFPRTMRAAVSPEQRFTFCSIQYWRQVSSPLTQFTIATSDLPLALFKPLGYKASFTYAKKNFMLAHIRYARSSFPKQTGVMDNWSELFAMRVFIFTLKMHHHRQFLMF